MPAQIAYGFVGMESLFERRISQVGMQRVMDAVNLSAAEHTRLVNALMSALVEKTTIAQEEFEMVATGTLQPLDELGIPRPTDVFGSYQVAYPIQGGGDAWGTNRVTSRMMTVGEANRHVIEAQNKDADWMARHIIAAWLTKTTWTFKDKVGPNGQKGLGDITIMPLANGDSVTYPIKGKQPATANHYTGQANAIDDSNNPFPTFYSTLNSYLTVNSRQPVVAYIPENQQTAVENLATFHEVEDSDLEAAVTRDRLRSSIEAGFGDELLGKVGKVWVVLWRRLPDNYIPVHHRGAGSIMKMREYPESSLQGFFTETHSPDGARMETRMIRYAGFGCSNRIGAMAHYVGNGTYPNPTDYTAPLAQ